MQKFLTVTATLAALAAFAASPCAAEEAHVPGGPLVSGASCWTSTNNDMGYGYWGPCPKPAAVARKKRK